MTENMLKSYLVASFKDEQIRGKLCSSAEECINFIYEIHSSTDFPSLDVVELDEKPRFSQVFHEFEDESWVLITSIGFR
jgi:hypothetical protein